MGIKKKDMKIGRTIFQYSSPNLLKYEIIGENTLNTDWHSEVFWIIECKTCVDHDNCKVAVKIDNYGSLEYSHMINNYSEDYDEENDHYRNNEYYWHKENMFFLSAREARIYIHEENKKYLSDKINDFKKNIEEYEERIKKIKTEIDILKIN